MPTLVAFETLTELYQNLVQKYENSLKTAFAFKPAPDADYKTVTWSTVRDDVNALASYLIDFGIEKDDRVAILSENRYEWAIVDLAIQMVGAINVSLYTTLPPKQCEFILKDSEAKLFFVSTGIQLKKAVEVFDNCPDLKHVVAFDEPKVQKYMENDFVSLFDTVCVDGVKSEPKNSETIKKRALEAEPENVATLIYTSGTTGNPKGAMLTHRNIVSNVKSAHEAISIGETDRCLSFLPLCHSFERTGGYYAMMAGGAEIYYAESVDTVAKNMLEVHPTIVISVPRLFEKIYNLVMSNVKEGSAIQQSIFEWALDIGKRYWQGERGLISMQKKIADKLVFDKLKQRTGGNIRFFVSGGAALPADIGTFFMSAGLNILEGYGLTETSPVMCCNRYGEEEMGTVGKVINGVTVGIQRLEDSKIIAQLSGEDYPSDLTSEEGEILNRGPNTMKGYWKNEEATNEMIDKEGWLHTGDVGKFENGRLKITDRIKHMIVNAGGKNIYPGPIEDMFKTSPWIDQLVVVGEKRSYMAALIVPDFEAIEKYAKQNDIKYSGIEELLQNEAVQNLYNKEIRSFSKELASHEKLRDFRLIPNEFTVETGELTPTLKVKRRIIEKKYGHLIEDIFEGDQA
ncbi:AMP-dependent synthetase/ligase [Rhodohalobacter barkolensis]|uniref:Long-chain fatty acid--CoA ligase n=1 Tax=Rhodohalobacter barkolensis TaxID=2053187 RepID=A0A2N0VF56_9BACT|nr:long-chain fatty acid--CoA ligase [Rhodohalobacter barkolensis]PKD42831.1 long-chain fatty acid--CoA ligase [Rhodohalobacter barkolensis]